MARCEVQTVNMLAIETATPILSVAVTVGGRVFERRVEDPAARAEGVLELLRGLLTEAETSLAALDVIAFGRGPGSFTGLRVAAAIAQGLAYAQDLPVIPISSLAALAQEAVGTDILAAIDARRDEVYYGFFTRSANGLVEPVGAEAVDAPASIPLPTGRVYKAVGSGFDHYWQALHERPGLSYEAHKAPNARAILMLAQASFERGAWVNAAQALPIYLRDNVVQGS